MLHECLLIFAVPHSHVVILTQFLSLWGVRMWQVNENRRLTFVYSFILKNNVLFLFTSHSQTAGNLATVQCTTQRGVLARFFHHKESKVETEVRFFCNFLELTYHCLTLFYMTFQRMNNAHGLLNKLSRMSK